MTFTRVTEYLRCYTRINWMSILAIEIQQWQIGDATVISTQPIH